MNRTIFASAAFCAALLARAAVAAESLVGEVVVTATRLPTALDEVTGARVVDRNEIEARQAFLLTDVLATLPGVGVSRSGAFGGVASISIRGANPDKTLVLVDGVPVGDPSQPQGNFDAASLQLADVERIEVLSGPQGALWGSEAIGGVIAITTRELDGLEADAEGGAFNTFRTSVGAGVSRAGYGVSGSLAGSRSDGVSKADRRDGASERDGFTTVTADLAGRIEISDKVGLEARLRYSESDTDLDGFPFPTFLLADTGDRYERRDWSGLLRARVRDVAGLDHELSLSAYDIERRGHSDFPYAYAADRQVYRWTAERGEADAPVAFVFGAERAEISADLDGRDTVDLGATSAFGVARGRLGERLTITGSLRYDDPDKFKTRATGRLSAAAKAGAGFTLTASAGQGFKVPTISQVICDFCFPSGPSTGLKPERAEGYDLRLGWTSPEGRYTAAVTGYRLSVRDQIAYAGRYVNVARTRSAGVEFEGEARLSETLRLKLAYAVMDAVNRDTGESLLRVPDRSGAAILLWDAGRWSGALTVRGESSQADTGLDGFSPAIRKGFWTADLAGAYALNDAVSLTARIENLADEPYQEAFGYGEPGRAVYVGFRLKR